MNYTMKNLDRERACGSDAKSPASTLSFQNPASTLSHQRSSMSLRLLQNTKRFHQNES